RGKKAKCPACGQPIIVEESKRETSVTDKPRRRAERPRDDDGSDPELRKPIKRQPAKSNLMIYGLGGGCVFLLLSIRCVTGLGAGIWYMFFRGTADDLIYVHEGVAGFVTFRIADTWKSPVVQDQLKKLPPEAKRELDEKLKELEAKDQKPEDWERVTFI